MLKKSLFIIIFVLLISWSLYSEPERIELSHSLYPRFFFGLGGTIDLSIQGIDDKFIHLFFVYSPLQLRSIVFSLRLFLLGNTKNLQLRIAVTATFRLFHYQWGEIIPFLGCGAGVSFINNNIPFIFLHYGIDLYLQPRLFFSIGSNLLFIGENFMDFDLFLSLALSF